MTPWSQRDYDLRFDWGIRGARELAADVTVVVDVWSFSTSVDILVGRGTEVLPCPWQGTELVTFAAERDAALAVPRADVDETRPWSLSPAALLAAPPVERLVLPSRNGSAIAWAAAGDVVAACLRNYDAVAEWLAASDYESIAVIAGGERWEDGSLRPALEDLLGAGALIDGLLARSRRVASPEALAARSAYSGEKDLQSALRTCGSARELIAAGFEDDLEAGAALGASRCVPLARASRGFVDVASGSVSRGAARRRRASR